MRENRKGALVVGTGTNKTLGFKEWLLLLFWGTVFFPLYPLLVDTWLDNSNDSHGLIVPLISAYFVWKNRSELKGITVQADRRGAVLLIASLTVYIISFAAGVTVVSRSMIVFSLMGLVLYNYGTAVFRKLAFPLLFLFFMIPIPVSIAGLVSVPLQRLATDISAVLIRIASIPVYQEGNMLYFAQTQLEVAEACSGIHSMMAMLMLATVMVYITRMSTVGKVLLIASTLPIATIANVARVAGTGMLAHFYGASLARGFLHDFSGIAVFLLGLILLIATCLLLQRLQKDDRTRSG